MTALETIRTDLEQPITISSGYRCEQYQQQLRASGYETAQGVSQHELGNAADMRASSMGELLLLCKRYFLSVGAARNFIHVDIRTDKPRLWAYSNV